MKCKHCHRDVKIKARGLCQLCYNNEAIRVRYACSYGYERSDEPTAEEVERVYQEQLATLPPDDEPGEPDRRDTYERPMVRTRRSWIRRKELA